MHYCIALIYFSNKSMKKEKENEKVNANEMGVVIGVDNSSRPKINFIIIGKTLGFLDYFFDVSCTDFGV